MSMKVDGVAKCEDSFGNVGATSAAIMALGLFDGRFGRVKWPCTLEKR